MKDWLLNVITNDESDDCIKTAYKVFTEYYDYDENHPDINKITNIVENSSYPIKMKIAVQIANSFNHNYDDDTLISWAHDVIKKNIDFNQKSMALGLHALWGLYKNGNLDSEIAKKYVKKYSDHVYIANLGSALLKNGDVSQEWFTHYVENFGTRPPNN